MVELAINFQQINDNSSDYFLIVIRHKLRKPDINITVLESLHQKKLEENNNTAKKGQQLRI